MLDLDILQISTIRPLANTNKAMIAFTTEFLNYVFVYTTLASPK